mmetsp:Transcript_10168/g.12434  ORF Transcript_10168/g.12434 Transcript_10168/m.12434 type:complete len:182 (+) Transcript_10168:1-546(+)
MEAEGSLSDILSRQDCTMDNFIGVMKEGKDLKKRMKRTMDLIMYHNLLGFVIDSDLNQNSKIGAMEIDLLIHRLDTFDYFNIDEKRLREMINHNEGDIYATVADIVDIIENGEEEEVDQFLRKNEEEFFKRFSHTDRSNIVLESNEDGNAKSRPSTSEAAALVLAEFSELAESENSSSGGE